MVEVMFGNWKHMKMAIDKRIGKVLCKYLDRIQDTLFGDTA